MSAHPTIRDGDKLLIYSDNEIFAVEANIVVEVLETEQFFMLPVIASPSPHSNREFIKGTMTHRGEVIVVIDLSLLFNSPPSQIGQRDDNTIEDGGPCKVAITRKDASSLGIYIGKRKLSFLWKEELSNLELKPSNEDYTLGLIDPSGKKIRLIDWQKILTKTQEVLSNRNVSLA